MDHPEPKRPTLETIYQAAHGLAPLLRERARQTELERRVSAEVTQRALDAGLFRLMQPARFGGYEYGFGPFTEVNRITGRACGSSSWCLSIAMVHQWLLALFPDAAQQDVWGQDPGAIMAASYAPAGRLRSVEGGWMATGQWSWMSNIDNVEWAVLGCMAPSAEGGKSVGGFILVPSTGYRIIDDWHAVGLSGTGSKSIELSEQFVPAHRYLTFADTNGGNAPGTRVNANPVYRLPFLSCVPLCLATPALGIAEGALEEFIAWASGRSTRGAVAGSGNRVAEFAQVQSRIAEAAACLDAAHLLVKRDVEDIEARAAAGLPIDTNARIRNRRDHAFCARLATQAADALFQATGGAGLMLDSPIQRAWRDVHAIARHISLNWDAVSTMYGQHRFGLEPRGQY
jgi:alkylation response protein AidB-like acyl-CoA dehydrogenase